MANTNPAHYYAAHVTAPPPTGRIAVVEWLRPTIQVTLVGLLLNRWFWQTFIALQDSRPSTELDLHGERMLWTSSMAWHVMFMAVYFTALHLLPRARAATLPLGEHVLLEGPLGTPLSFRLGWAQLTNRRLLVRGLLTTPSAEIPLSAIADVTVRRWFLLPHSVVRVTLRDGTTYQYASATPLAWRRAIRRAAGSTDGPPTARC